MLCSLRFDRNCRPRCWCQSAQPTRVWVANSVCQLPANSVINAISASISTRLLARASQRRVDYALESCPVASNMLAAISACGIATVWAHALEALALSPAGVRAFSWAHALRPLARTKSVRVDSRIIPTVVQWRELGVANHRVSTIVSACISPRLLARARKRRVGYALY